VLEKRVLRIIFISGTEDKTGGRGKLKNEEFHDLFGTLIVSRTVRLVGNIARTVDLRKEYLILVGIHERKIPLGRRGRVKCDVLTRLRVNVILNDCLLGCCAM
jgi:hypothetical protein